MVWLTRIDGSQLMLNDDQIVFIEPSHDTILTLTTGEKLRVQESADQVAERVAHWRRRVMGLDLVSGVEFDEGA